MSLAEEREVIPGHVIEAVHANANFGSISKRDVVRQGVLKAASGYHQGSTSQAICLEHGLITHTQTLTTKGRMYLWAAFNTSPIAFKEPS